MRFPLSLTLLCFAGAAAAMGACGPNVILDGGSASTGTGAATGNGGAGIGGASGTGTTTPGVGVSVTNTVTVGTGGFPGTSTAVGPGGSFSATSTAAVGTGGGFAGPSSVTVGTGGGSVTTATSTGSGVTSACGHAADGEILNSTVIYPLMVMCATANLGNSAGETSCIQSSTGLSSACTGCVVDDVLCSLKACFNSCASDANGTTCEQCRNQNCAGAFHTCSGLGDAPGWATCGDLLAMGMKGTMGFESQAPADAFITVSQRDAFNGLYACACKQLAPSGCEDVCTAGFGSGPPDFCDGSVANKKCRTCLESTCGSQIMTCESAN